MSDEYDEINLGVVQVEYETQRERLNEPTNEPKLIGTPTSFGSGCSGVLLFFLLSIAVMFVVVRLFF